MSIMQKTARRAAAMAVVAGVLSTPVALAWTASAQPPPGQQQPQQQCGHPGQPACPPPH